MIFNVFIYCQLYIILFLKRVLYYISYLYTILRYEYIFCIYYNNLTLLHLYYYFLVESLIWRLLIQLLSATRYVHMRGLAVRVIEPAHIILTSGTCARYSTVGKYLTFVLTSCFFSM